MFTATKPRFIERCALGIGAREFFDVSDKAFWDFAIDRAELEGHGRLRVVATPKVWHNRSVRRRVRARINHPRAPPIRLRLVLRAPLRVIILPSGSPDVSAQLGILPGTPHQTKGLSGNGVAQP